MGIGADKMDESLFDQGTGELLNLRSEGACQASCCHLQQAASLDQGTHDAWLVEDAAIAFRVRQDANQPGSRQLGQQSIQGNVDIVGQLEQHVAAAIAQRKDFAGSDSLRQIRFDSHVGARKHPQRHPPPVQEPLKLGGRRANDFARVLGVAAQLVGRRNDRFDPVGHRHLGHGECLVPTGRTVVETGQEMAMDVDKWFGTVHDEAGIRD